MMKATNTMANVVPHEAYQNVHGLWRYSEKLTECYRDEGTVSVWLGNIWGNDTSNDHFIDSRGVPTPDYLWKVLIRTNGEVNAWLIPNDRHAKSTNAEDYEVTILEILNLIDYRVPTLEKFSRLPTSKTWWLPKGCSLK